MVQSSSSFSKIWPSLIKQNYCFMAARWHLNGSLAPKAQLKRCADKRQGQLLALAPSCCFQFTSVNFQWSDFTFHYTVGDGTVHWHSRDVYRVRVQEEHLQISHQLPRPRVSPCGRGVCRAPGLTMATPIRLRFCLRCRRKNNPNAALTLPRHSCTKSIEAKLEWAPPQTP